MQRKGFVLRTVEYMREMENGLEREKDGVRGLYTFRANEKGIKNGLELARKDKSGYIYVRRGTM